MENERIEVSFPESSLVLYLETIDFINVKCIWKNYGLLVSEETFMLEKYDVIQIFKHLLREILNQAVQTGYITDSEKKEFCNRIVIDDKEVLTS
ncbi:hypothetical protein [Sphaerospermopsis torques-reginae]|uniref:Uncharacterized protein n=1 Tax=Sphaerospermopsis torques-reginae ITEP-024 TaxID=984208 RepID=A0ABX8WZA5_9CYAN|nr:hypothetical protein [Sphaerospermopsis torques-reginae]QYX31753.1 hypothetical protein K2F26_23785 [Sphaerospermopsis torques-reginae ITEP-024]